MKKYKVISQKDKWFSGKFDPALLEKMLNEHAADGWRVVSMASASREGLLTGGGKDELIVLLEKDAGVAAPRMGLLSEPSADGVYSL
jgi:hypothetical protein